MKLSLTPSNQSSSLQDVLSLLQAHYHKLHKPSGLRWNPKTLRLSKLPPTLQEDQCTHSLFHCFLCFSLIQLIVIFFNPLRKQTIVGNCSQYEIYHLQSSMLENVPRYYSQGTCCSYQTLLPSMVPWVPSILSPLSLSSLINCYQLVTSVFPLCLITLMNSKYVGISPIF